MNGETCETGGKRETHKNISCESRLSRESRFSR